MLRARIGGVVLGLAMWQASLVPASATCRPSALDPTWIAAFAEQRGSKLSAAEVEALTTSGAIAFYPIRFWPSSGPAPLQVGIFWWPFVPEGVKAIEIDADGDGRPEVVDTRDERLGYTYQRPGHFAAAVTVRYGDGKVTTYKRPVTVLSPEAFDAELQSRWAAFKAALKRGDLEAALECVHHLRREHLTSNLSALLRADVEQELPPIRFVKFRVIEAGYESVRPPPGRQRPLDVRFQLDLDGAWRIGALEP